METLKNAVIISLILLSSGIYLTMRSYQKTITLQRQETKNTIEKYNSTLLMLEKQVINIKKINEISSNERKLYDNAITQNKKRTHQIKTTMQGIPCSDENVPVDITERLRQHAEEIH